MNIDLTGRNHDVCMGKRHKEKLERTTPCGPRKSYIIVFWNTQIISDNATFPMRNNP